MLHTSMLIFSYQNLVNRMWYKNLEEKLKSALHDMTWLIDNVCRNASMSYLPRKMLQRYLKVLWKRKAVCSESYLCCPIPYSWLRPKHENQRETYRETSWLLFCWWFMCITLIRKFASISKFCRFLNKIDCPIKQHVFFMYREWIISL